MGLLMKVGAASKSEIRKFPPTSVEIEEVSCTFGVMKNLIWTRVHFNIILPNVKSETAYTFVGKHIQTHTATASPADGGNHKLRSRQEQRD